MRLSFREEWLTTISTFLVCTLTVAVADTCSCGDTCSRETETETEKLPCFSLFAFCTSLPPSDFAWWTEVSECCLPDCSVALSCLTSGMLWSSFHGRWKEGGGPPESLHRGSENKGSIQQRRPEKQAVMSRRPRTQTHVMTQNTTCLESDQLLLLIITVGGLSVSRQTRSAWKRGQDRVLPTKTLFRQPSSAGSLSGRFI